jgi:hypothetical protein
VTPASPETPIDADELVPVQPAGPGALPVEDEPEVAVEPAAPQATDTSVPTSVPAGGGAASSDR